MWGWWWGVVALFVAGVSVVATPPTSEDSASKRFRRPGVCESAGTGVGHGRSHPDDGTPDPEGRIVFGVFQRNHEIWGQIVSLSTGFETPMGRIWFSCSPVTWRGRVCRRTVLGFRLHLAHQRGTREGGDDGR